MARSLLAYEPYFHQGIIREYLVLSTSCIKEWLDLSRVRIDVIAAPPLWVAVGIPLPNLLYDPVSLMSLLDCLLAIRANAKRRKIRKRCCVPYARSWRCFLFSPFMFRAASRKCRVDGIAIAFQSHRVEEAESSNIHVFIRN